MPDPTLLTQDLYATAYVKDLFDEMSGTYALMNYVTSFGFSERWRRQCVAQLSLAAGMQAYDLMTGMGESWTFIVRGVGRRGKITAVDISPNMLAHARARLGRFPGCNIELLEGDVLANDFAADSADCVVCLFGVKTLSDAQQKVFAGEVRRILKPGGQYALVEISVPANWLLRTPYMFYLKYVIPLLGRLVLGNPENYRMLGRYAERFGNCRRTREIFDAAGLQAEYAEYFFGCATGVWGRKPA